MEVAVCRLRPHRAGVHTDLCAEQLKKWRREEYPRENLKTPPKEGAMAVTGINSTSHVVHRRDTPGAGMDGPGPNYKGDHRHMSNQPVIDPVEGGGGAY